MASGIVRGAISTVLGDPKGVSSRRRYALGDPKLVQSSRSDEMRQFGGLFLAKIVENDDQIDLFDTFRATITSEMNTV
jgi:hypothetical protein